MAVLSDSAFLCKGSGLPTTRDGKAASTDGGADAAAASLVNPSGTSGLESIQGIVTSGLEGLEAEQETRGLAYGDRSCLTTPKILKEGRPCDAEWLREVTLDEEAPRDKDDRDEKLATFLPREMKEADRLRRVVGRERLVPTAANGLCIFSDCMLEVDAETDLLKALFPI